MSPPLSFLEIPQSAESLTLIVDDPDAPGGTWLHWLVYNIDPHIKGFTESQRLSSDQEGITSFGKPGYGGPCPPSGVHHYHFKLYALDSLLDLPGKAVLEQVTSAMKNHILDQAELTGLYERTK